MALLSKKKFEDVDAETGEVIVGASTEDTAVSSVAEDAAAEQKRKNAERVASALAARAAEEAAKTVEAVPVADVQPAARTSALAAKGNSGSLAKFSEMDPFAQLENQFPVEFNTLRQIKADQGSFNDKDTEKSLGAVVGLEVISTQEHWVLTPGDDDDEATKLLKYSSDGITSQDGYDMKEELRKLKEGGYPDARINKRIYLVGNLFNSGTLPDLTDTLVQIDLSPSSVAHYLRHRLSTTFNIGKGKLSAEGQHMLRLECVRKSKGKRAWTEVVPSQWK